MLLLVTLHFGYQSYGWSLYGLTQLEWKTDTCPPTGIAAYALLIWLNFSSFAPIRHRIYEIFVAQHILSFFAFVYLVMAHLPSTAYYSRVYVYAGIGIYFLDRLIRTLRYVYHNIYLSRASLEALDGGVTKIRVQSKQIKSWAPGSHVFLSIPYLGFGQSHPATIASIPSSHNGDLIFFLKGQKGFTNRLLKTASSSQITILPDSRKFEKESSTFSDKTYITLIGGPYGGSYSDPIAFDTVLLVSGSTGVTFTLAILQSLAHRCETSHKLPLRVVNFVWAVKQVSWTSWIARELVAAVSHLRAKGIEVKVTVHVTCDSSFTDFPADKATSGCRCDLSLGPCCCERDIPMSLEIEENSISDTDEDTTALDKGGNAMENKTHILISEKTSSSVNLPTGPKNLASIATFKSGRPDMGALVWALAEQAEGEMGIFACGPLGMSTTIRNTVASVSNERAVHKGTGAEGIFLHVEGFGW
jgi:ferric-chelate reductase